MKLKARRDFKKNRKVSLTKIILFILLLTPFICFSQDEYEIIQLESEANQADIEVGFLINAPAIDGVLDKTLEKLPVQKFKMALRQEGEELISSHYRLAYGLDFFIYM